MRILHLPYCYYPSAVGGTEVYVRDLCHYLNQKSVENHILISGREEKNFSYEGVSVHQYFHPRQNISLRMMYGQTDPQFKQSLAKKINDINPDIVHFHSVVAAQTFSIAEILRENNIPSIFTYHTPTASCSRGTLLKWGSSICNGELKTRVCTACTLQGLGLRAAFSQLLALMPTFAGKLVSTLKFKGGAWTALQMSSLLTLRNMKFMEYVKGVNHVVAPSEWVAELLILNGVPRNKILISKQGVPIEVNNCSRKEWPSNFSKKIRMGFFGRLHPTKGLHIVLEALKQASLESITLDVFGIVQDKADHDYRDQMQKKTASMTNVHWHMGVLREALMAQMKECDVVLVPSQCLETGPLVALEALALGIPVLGSDLGGLRDFILHSVNGLLIPHDSIETWKNVFVQIARDPAMLTEFSKKVHTQKTMVDVSQEMFELYTRVCA